jgi:predicted Zn-dependent peptidase
MLSMGKSMLLFDRIDSASDVFHKIELVTEEEVLEVSNEIFAADYLSSLLYLNKSKNKPKL